MRKTLLLALLIACVAGCWGSQNVRRDDDKNLAKSKEQPKKDEPLPITKDMVNENNALQQANALQAEMNRDEQGVGVASAKKK